MRGIYVFSDANRGCSKEILEFLSDMYKSILPNSVSFLPFSSIEALNLLAKGNERDLIKSAIKKMDSLKDKFIIANATNEIPIIDKIALNSKVANSLNLPVLLICYDEQEARIMAREFRKNKANIFGYIIDKELYLEGENRAVSFEEIRKNPKFLTNLPKSCEKKIITPEKFESILYAKAASNIKTIVLPESGDDRILKACDILNASKSVNLILLGKENVIKNRANELGLNLEGVSIIDHENNEFGDEFAQILFELRKSKGMTLEKAGELVRDKTYFGTMLVHTNKADAMVSGASTTTAETIRPALQIIKMKPGVSGVSGAFLMCLDTEVMVFADCAITPNPTAEQLAGVAISSAITAKAFGIEPRVAMLSYSTGDSGSGEDVNFVIEATNKAKELEPNLAIDGPLQFDAAIDEIVAKKKLPNSTVAGKANVFIFPNLNCGNICYKAVQRTSGAIAIGPILQGLKKPVNDLSRGCLVEDIVNTILISAIQAGE